MLILFQPSIANEDLFLVFNDLFGQFHKLATDSSNFEKDPSCKNLGWFLLIVLGSSILDVIASIQLQLDKILQLLQLLDF